MRFLFRLNLSLHVGVGKKIDVIGKFGERNFETEAVFGCKVPNSKKNFRHLHGDLNLDEIKNTLHSCL